jgi:hypothetical protein
MRWKGHVSKFCFFASLKYYALSLYTPFFQPNPFTLLFLFTRMREIILLPYIFTYSVRERGKLITYAGKAGSVRARDSLGDK